MRPARRRPDLKRGTKRATGWETRLHGTLAPRAPWDIGTKGACRGVPRSKGPSLLPSSSYKWPLTLTIEIKWNSTASTPQHPGRRTRQSERVERAITEWSAEGAPSWLLCTAGAGAADRKQGWYGP